MNIGRNLLFLLTTLIAISSIDYVESSELKQARRSIENAEESATKQRKWSPRRRLTMADDVFTGTSREFEVIGFHRVVGATVIKIIGKFLRGVGSLIDFTKLQLRSAINAVLHSTIGILQSMQNKVAIEEPEPDPTQTTTMSLIYDSISSVMSSSEDSEPISKESPPVKREQTPDARTTTTSSPTNNVKQKATTKAAPLRGNKTLPKATSRGALGKKSIMEDLAEGGSSSSAFHSVNSAVTLSEEDDVSALPPTSRLASFLPTLVAGLVFTTAGSMVGYLWNNEWIEMASSYVNYFWGETETETGSFFDAATSSSAEDHDDISSSSAIPVTPDKF